MNPVTRIGGWAVAVFALGSSLALADAEPPELRKLYALLVIDTLSGLGESVAVDGNRIEHLLRGSVPSDRLELTRLTDKDVTAARILDYFQKMKSGPTDALLFYYAGHGATDPQQGHFLALQQLDTTPLLRSELRRAMSAHHPGLAIILTDCCSTRHSLGKSRKITVAPGAARRLDPAMRCLFFQHRGVVDVTATAEGAAFSDDEDGGLFTRTLVKMIDQHATNLSRSTGKFVSWVKLFHDVEVGTAREFAHWSVDQQARGEKLEQKTQKPRAFELPRDPTRPTLTLLNGTHKVVRYRCRWGTDGDWDQVVMAPDGRRLHVPPIQPGPAAEVPALRIEFEDGETASLKVGKSYRYTPDGKKTRSIEHMDAEP